MSHVGLRQVPAGVEPAKSFEQLKPCRSFEKLEPCRSFEQLVF